MHAPLNPKIHTNPAWFFLHTSRPLLPVLSANIILYCLGALALVGTSYFIGQIVDALTHVGSASRPVAGLIIVLILHEVFFRLGHICEIYSLARIRATTKQALFDHTASLSFGYFADRFAGELAHKVATTADAFERMTITITNNFVTNAFMLILSVLVLGLVHPTYAVFLVFWWTLFILGSLFFAKKLHAAASHYAIVEAQTTGAVVDVYGNIATVKVYGKAEHFQATHRQIATEADGYRRLGIWDVLTYHFQGVSLIVLCVGVIVISGSLFRLELISIGQIAFIASFIFQLFDTIWEMARNVADFVRFRGEAAQNLADLVVAPGIVDGANPQAKAKEPVSLNYNQVTFGYTASRPILRNFSLQIAPGEKVGIVGLSGEGKTTIANLLLRFFDPQSGQILLNGTDIREFTQEALRAHISYISQDSSLFHATVAQNIAYGATKPTKAAIEQAAKLAYADEFIRLLPQGYQSVVGERGVKLSGGQRQRIAVARAILADRPFFLLDEATSALDSDSEAKIQKGLATLMEHKTVIAIAHRLSTLSHMDRIVFLEGGKIAEEGTHAQLLKMGKKYATLWHMQAGGFLPDVPNLPLAKPAKTVSRRLPTKK